MKKTILIVFLAIFLLMCLVPSMGLLIFGASDAAANEILAQPPRIKTEDGKLNFDFLSDAGSWLSDHFALRQEYITANAAVEAALFRESASEEVILGKEGWLFYSSTMDDYLGQNLLSDREIWSAAHCLSMVQMYAASHGSSFLFTVAPNKNTLYPQFMPSSATRSEVPGNLMRLNAALAQEGVNYLDLFGVFCAENAVLYHRLDSHWNNLGAALAHDAIMEKLCTDYVPRYLPAQFSEEASHDGDLYQMLYPAGTQKDIQLLPDFALDFTYQRPIRSPEDQTILTASENKTGKLLMFRDSFGNTLHTFMAESFGEACFSRAMPYTMSLLDTEQPDTLVIEIVERNISWLTQRAPEMPAPVCDLALPQTQTNCDAVCTCTQRPDGMFCYTGSLFDAPDTQSPIYLLCDGVLYEAFPVGEGENPFTAYISAQADTVQVLFERDGSLILSQPITCEQ